MYKKLPGTLKYINILQPVYFNVFLHGYLFQSIYLHIFLCVSIVFVVIDKVKCVLIALHYSQIIFKKQCSSTQTHSFT